MTLSLQAAIESANRVQATRLEREANARRVAALHRTAYEGRPVPLPNIRMVISEWYHDEFGNLTRTTRAAE